MKKTPASVSITLLLIFLNTAFWLVYAIIAMVLISDQVGAPDLFTLILSLAALILLIKNRVLYLAKNGNTTESG